MIEEGYPGWVQVSDWRSYATQSLLHSTKTTQVTVLVLGELVDSDWEVHCAMARKTFRPAALNLRCAPPNLNRQDSSILRTFSMS